MMFMEYYDIYLKTQVRKLRSTVIYPLSKLNNLKIIRNICSTFTLGMKLLYSYNYVTRNV